MDFVPEKNLSISLSYGVISFTVLTEISTSLAYPEEMSLLATVRAMSVLPEPVGASRRTAFPFSIAFVALSAAFDCHGLTCSCGFTL